VCSQQVKSLDEAAEHVCEILEEKEPSLETMTEKSEKNLYFASAESVGERLMLNMRNSDYKLTVDRDEVWRGALIFDKKALTNADILWNNLTISFKGEDGLDAGAIKAEFLECC